MKFNQGRIQKITKALRLHRIGKVILKGIFIYIGVTLTFGFLYWIFEALEFNPETNGRITNFFTSLYFSCVTFTTIGYGDIVPKAGIGHILVFIESCGSLLFTPVFGGFLAYKLLQRPNDILLTNNFYIRNRNQSVVMSIRLGNRGKHIIDCNATVEFIQVTNNVKRTLLTVGFSKPIIELTWYLDIRLDGQDNAEALKQFKTLMANQASSIIRVTAIGIDSETGNMAHVYKYYEMNKLVYGGHFVDVYHWHGVRRLKPNWNNLNSIEPLTCEEKKKIDELIK